MVSEVRCFGYSFKIKAKFEVLFQMVFVEFLKLFILS